MMVQFKSLFYEFIMYKTKLKMVLKQLEKVLLKLSTIRSFSKNFKILLKIMRVVQQR